MKLVLVGDDGEYLDHVHCADDELGYAMEDGGAATLLLGNLLPMSYHDNDGDAGVLSILISNGHDRTELFDDDCRPDRV